MRALGAAVDYIQRVPVLYYEDFKSDSVSWLMCPQGTGIFNSTNYPDCCGAVQNYCLPRPSCIPGGGCCQTGFNQVWTYGRKSWCCTEYPVCGTGGQCFAVAVMVARDQIPVNSGLGAPLVLPAVTITSRVFAKPEL